MSGDLKLPDRKEEKDAVRIIERNWSSYKDDQMFKLLKYAICAAEHSLTHEVLRKVSPSEASLLQDPVFQPIVKFRFAGSEFPPYIVFKVYLQNTGGGLKYLSGKRMIRPASEAASDACRHMGNRKFYEQMIKDLCQTQKDKITDEVDVTNLKEYMQYLKNTDEMPASLGGKDNSWRRLSLEILPRHNIMYDVMTFINSGVASPRLTAEMPHMVMTRPVTQENKLELVNKIYSTGRKPVSKASESSRRTKKAKDRVAKMKKMYGLSDKQPQPDQYSGDVNPMPIDAQFDTVEGFEDEYFHENWDEEGKHLYEWSQKLSVEAVNQ